MPSKTYMSSSGFIHGRLQICSSSGSCLRNILLQANGIRTNAAPKYAEMGKFNEDRFASEVAEDSNMVRADRECVLEIVVRDGCSVRGRADFVCYHEGQSVPYVVELKSADSPRTHTEVFKKGKVKTDNLAQVVTYMIAVKTTVGQLIYTFFERDEENRLIKTDERLFAIDISETGAILVDNRDSGFTVNDRLERLQIEADVVEQSIVWDRPKDWDFKFGSPCTFCTWNKVCMSYDNGDINSGAEFVSAAKKHLEEGKVE